MLVPAYLHTILYTLWWPCCTPNSSRLVLGKFGRVWHRSFNGVLSGKSFSLAAFISCHFTNSVSACVCARMCATSLCLQERKRCFPKSAQARTSLHGSVLAMSYRVQLKETAVVCQPTHPSIPPSLPPSLLFTHRLPQFFVSQELHVHIFVYLNVPLSVGVLLLSWRQA